MARVIPLVMYTETGRKVLGEVNVDDASAELNETGIELLDERVQPPIDENGDEIEAEPLLLQFVLNPHFPSPGDDAA